MNPSACRIWTRKAILLILPLCFIAGAAGVAAAEEPLSLPDVLRIALAENPLIAAWDAKVKAGEGGLASAKAFPNPE
ncbi:MAG: hypothetical protein QHH30_08675, partial [candidate division NC10 bacterium]|nr:hypothetical protein [candidate division NC10 bacterium]